MKELSDRIAALTPEQKAVFELLRKKSAAKKPAPAAPPPIPRRAGPGPAPLSFDQERLWFLGQLDPESAAYNIDTAIRMKGRLDIPVLRAVLSEIVRRHEAWRTVFPAVAGRPVQVALPPRPVELPVVDLTALSPAEREARVFEVAHEEARTPMDLARGPLVRVRLLRLTADEHICLMTVHHIVSDWYSFNLAWMEIAALYPAFLEARPSPLPEPPVQYADFAVWQRSWLEGEVLDNALDFWTKELADYPRVLELPTDRPRPAAQTTRGRRARISFPPARAEAFRALSRREGVTPFMASLAGFDALLARWSGQEKIVVGSPNANRNRPEIERLLGFFVSQLVFATDVSGNPTFREILGRAKKTALAAYAHQELPFGKLVEALNPERDASRAPLAQVNLLVLDTASTVVELPSLTFSGVDVDDGSSLFDTTLSLFDNAAEGIHGWFEYNVDLWDAATMERLARAFEGMVERVSADPAVPLAEIPLLPEGAAHQVLSEWNDTAAAGDLRPVDRLFEERAEESPGAVALVVADRVFSDLEVTYGELDRAANRLAHRLRRLGAGRESRVGLMTGRGPELLVGLLGIWKAGGAYVPLDPGYPPERLAFLVEDAGIEVAVTGPELAGLLPGQVRTVALDGVASLAGEPEERPEGPRAEPGDLAYVIYTSGTTGKPKGVMVEHGNLASTILASRLAFGWGRGDRIPVLAPFSFDIFLFEVMSPLTAGGTVELVPLVPALDLNRLMAALGTATRLHAVPALMRQISALVRAGAARPGALKTLFVGGDAVPPDLLAEMRAAFPGAEIRVLYGPTEGTIICSSWAVPEDGALAGRAMLGRPLANVDLRIYDRQGGLALPGAPGELWIGGPGVTRGYLNRPDLTAEKLVTRDGRCWYRTGDLARLLPDGSLEFAGRVDQQVKVRGFRVEPGEIEARLAAHPAVREAVVLPQDVAGGDKRLVAFVVPEGEVAEGDLRAFLGETLPEYMVPGVFVTLPELPVTAHGKVDRKALLGMETAAEPAPAAVPADRTAPRTPAEEILARIWRAVLRVDEVSVHDNFFRLGGDSILSIQVVARARQEGLLLTPRQMFESQTVAALAAVAVPAQAEEEQGPVEGEAPLTPVQLRFFAEERPEPGWFDQTLLFEAREALDPERLKKAVAALVEHHDALRLRFVREEGRWRQVHAPVGEVPFFTQELPAGFDLETGPLFRAVLLGKERLLLSAHHLAVDGVSWRILLEDLAAAYAGHPLPAKTTSWKRWAERLADYARSEEVRAELGFWRGQPMPDQPLPVDREDGPNTVGSAATVSVSLDAETTEALLKRAPAAYRTEINDLLLAALARTLAGWTGAGRHRIELEGHGREDVIPGADLSRTVGWFTTVFPVVLDVQGHPGPGEAIRAVKETLRAVPNRGIGYGLLRYLSPEGESLASLPEPEVGFNYLGRVDGAVPGVLVPSDEPTGATESPEAPRRHLLDVDALVHGGVLKVTWTYSRSRHGEATVERLARAFLSEVETLVAHCLSPGAGGYTPSDFPLARLDQAAIDSVLGRDRSVEDVYPLAPLQRGMLFHTLYAPGSEIYFEQLSVTFEGPLDGAAFGRAFQEVTDRQPVLRTAFVWEGLPEPLQVVRRGVPMPLVREDWRGVPADEIGERFAAYAAADRARGFDPGRPPLQRAALVRTGESSYRLLWSFHHILFDGWCFSPLFGEIFTLYEAYRRGAAPELPPVHPYRAYIEWLSRRDLSAAEAWWRARLAGFSAATPLPLTEAGEGRAARDFTERTVTLPAPLLASLQAFAQAQGLTLNTLMQGAWALLLSRMSGERDVVFGAVAAGRPADLPGVESMVGLFINTLPVRVEIDPEAGVAGWLRDLQARQAEMRSWEWSPLSDIQRWSAVPPGRPLFHSLLVFENYPIDPGLGGALPGITFGGSHLSEQTNYPLTLAFSLRGGDFDVRASFDGRLAPETAERLLGQLEALLAALAADPGRAVGDLPAFPDLPVLPRSAPAAVPVPEGAALPPRTPAEEALARVWRAVLRLDRVGREDDFFRLGGDSILSLQIVVRAREEGLHVTPKQIFENPTVAALAAVVTSLGEGASRETGSGEPGELPEEIRAALGEDRSVEDVYPLAPLQRGMLLHGVWAPGSTLYLEQLSCDLVGGLDVSAFTRAWQRVVDRHPALRTAFLWQGVDEPLQVVRRGVEMPWTVEDWRGEPEERVRAWAAEDFSRVFDLSRAPLLRAALLRTAEDRHRFVWSFHHILFDGWCFAILLREVFLFYEAFRNGSDLDLPRPRPYRDYIAWLSGRDPAEAEAYWRRTLAGFRAATPVPLDTPGGTPERAEPRDEVVTLPAGRTAVLEAFAQGRRLTLNTLAQAAWALLLSRFSGERDVVFGTVVSGRPPELPGVESMVGLFINTQPVRIAIDPGLPAGSWLKRVQEDQVEMRQHGWSPLPDVQGWSELPPGEPLFHTLLAFENFPLGEDLEEGAGGLAVTGFLFTDRADYPLSFSVTPGAAGLGLRLSHDHRVESATAQRLLGSFLTLLDGLAADPGRRLDEVPILSESERGQLLAWSAGEEPSGPAACLHELFEAQAQRTPGAVALVDDRGETTYAELDRRANRLANTLRGMGVGPEVRVGLSVPRSSEMVTAILGILKAGGAYVPVDPETPADRLAYLLEDAAASVVITEDFLAGPSWLDAPDTAPASGVAPENLAYVIYTSGSTGLPKGVMVRHASAAAYTRAMAAVYGIGPGDRAVQFASVSFDASVEEIFTALGTGAALFVRTGVEDASAFLARCRDWRITHLSLPTAYWHQAGEDPDLHPELRFVVIGGERALPERWGAWGRGAGARVRLVNAYGPTEATIAATTAEHPGTASALPRREVPIGRPLPGVAAHVLGRGLRLVPAGATGELCLGGECLARGYLGRPELTAEQFVPDPFGPPGARLYRTGDLVRRLGDGTLEFAGRADAQVKVRGFRIELGEVEAALSAHPGVREAAATTREDASGSRRLVAFVVPKAPGDPLADLRPFLAGRLPAYMVPSGLGVLDALPVTPAGKLDRRALDAVPVSRDAGAGYVAPRNPVEESLAAIWEELLGVDRVGLHDDFFALGGHSLLATQLVSRVRRQLGVDLPLHRLFELRTLSDLAREVLVRTLEEGEGSELDALMADLDGLSDEEALALLEEEGE